MISANKIQRFLEIESLGGIVLFIMALIAFIWANSSLSYLHQDFVAKFLFIINEGLMAFFFLLVGLELKKNYWRDNKWHYREVLLPFFASIGGILVPILIYLMINFHHPDTLVGWPAPASTDIAFALGVLALFGRRVPVELKIFLLALAIFDDIAAIVIIIFYYAQEIHYFYLLLSFLIMLALFLLNYWRQEQVIFYLLLGFFLWGCLLLSGINPTISGFLTALMIPYHSEEDSSFSKFENGLHPIVIFLILPLFALANAGFSLNTFNSNTLTSGIVLGITAGLFFGKQLGVFTFSWVLIKLRLVRLPKMSTWLSLYGVSILCGIGFTMSLFLGTLSFQNDNIYLAELRLGVIIGSLLSGLVGASVLMLAFAQAKHSKEQVIE